MNPDIVLKANVIHRLRSDENELSTDGLARGAYLIVSERKISTLRNTDVYYSILDWYNAVFLTDLRERIRGVSFEWLKSRAEQKAYHHLHAHVAIYVVHEYVTVLSFASVHAFAVDFDK